MKSKTELLSAAYAYCKENFSDKDRWLYFGIISGFINESIVEPSLDDAIRESMNKAIEDSKRAEERFGNDLDESIKEFSGGQTPTWPNGCVAPTQCHNSLCKMPETCPYGSDSH